MFARSIVDARHMRTSNVTAIIVSLALLAAPALAAAPQLREDSDKLVLENEHVSVWFQGKKPMLKVAPAEGGAAYDYTFTDVVEYRDIDGDNLASNNEVVARLDLTSASAWDVERAQSADEIVLNLTLAAPVKLGREALVPQADVALPQGDAIVSLLFSIREGASTIDVNGVNVTVPATSIKYDFIVTQWPFVNADVDRLALEMLVGGTLELANATGLEGADVLANGTSVGALSWTTLATGNTTEGTQVDVPVKVGVASGVDGATRLTYTYDAAKLASLIHDPTIGVTPTPAALEEVAEAATGRVNSVPLPGVAIVAAGLAGAALALGRRGRTE